MTNLPAKQLPLSDVPAAWQGYDVASVEEAITIERSKQPEDIVALPMFLITEIEELDTKFGKRHKYYITTPDGEEWNFTLGASSQTGTIGKLLQARLDFYEQFRVNGKAYVAALEAIPTQLGNDGYRFTTPVQRQLNEQARAGRSSQREQQIEQGLREPIKKQTKKQEVHPLDNLPF